MEDDLLREYILDTVTSVGAMTKMLDVFSMIDYDDYVTDINNIMHKDYVDSDDGKMIHDILVRHALVVLSSSGIHLTDDATAYEIAELMNGIFGISSYEPSYAESIIGMMETDDDDIMSFAFLMEDTTELVSSRVYSIVDKIDYGFMNVILSTLYKVSKNDDTASYNFKYEIELSTYLRSISDISKKLFKGISNTDRLLNQGLLTDETILSATFTDIKKFTPGVFGSTVTDIRDLAINIVYLLMLHKDSRKDMVKTYVDEVEDMINNEGIKNQLLSAITILVDEIKESVSALNGMIPTRGDKYE